MYGVELFFRSKNAKKKPKTTKTEALKKKKQKGRVRSLFAVTVFFFNCIVSIISWKSYFLLHPIPDL